MLRVINHLTFTESTTVDAQEVNRYQSPVRSAGNLARSEADRRAATNGVWRDGDYLILRTKRHLLPDRCVVCDAAADDRRVAISLAKLPLSAPVFIFVFSPYTGFAMLVITCVALMFWGFCPKLHLNARKIDGQFVWVAGVPEEFLERVPERCADDA